MMICYVQYIKNLRTFFNSQSPFPNDIIPPFFKTNSQFTFFIQNVLSPFISEKNYFLHAKMKIFMYREYKTYLLFILIRLSMILLVTIYREYKTYLLFILIRLSMILLVTIYREYRTYLLFILIRLSMILLVTI